MRGVAPSSFGGRLSRVFMGRFLSEGELDGDIGGQAVGALEIAAGGEEQVPMIGEVVDAAEVEAGTGGALSASGGGVEEFAAEGEVIGELSLEATPARWNQ